jgi:hypothetical protein
MKLKPKILDKAIVNQENKSQGLFRCISRIRTQYYSIILLLFVFSTKSFSKDIGINITTVAQPTYLNSQFSLITGGRAGINITPEFYFGLALYGTTLFKNKVDAIDPIVDDRPVLELFYYGLDAEYYILPKNTVHFSISTFVGWSDIFFNIPAYEDDIGRRYKPEYFNGKKSLILKPSVNLNLNLKHFYRIVLGISYRYLPGFEYNVPDLMNVSDNMPYRISSKELNGFAINVAVRFGSF